MQRIGLLMCLGMFALLGWSPLFEIGNTSVTDRVFLWGVAGLSTMVDPSSSALVSELQALTFVCAAGLFVTASLSPRFRVLAAWAAFAATVVLVTLAAHQASVLARHPDDIVPTFGIWGMVGVVVLVVLLAIVETERAGRSSSSSLDHSERVEQNASL